jgi:hypothetical protein
MSPTITQVITSVAGDYVTLSSDQTARLLTAGTQAGFALVDGDFNAVIRIVAEVGGIPSAAVISMEKVIGGDLRGGAEGLIPLAIEAMSPTLAEVITSMAGEYVTLTSNQTAMLLSAATKVAMALADGDFTGVVQQITDMAGLPSEVPAVIGHVFSGNFEAAASLVLIHQLSSLHVRLHVILTQHLTND